MRALAGLALAVLAACGGGSDVPVADKPASMIEVAPNPDDRWTLVAADSVGMDAATLAQAPASMTPGDGISSMLVMRHGQPVFEQYWNGYDKDTLHDMRSATKSVTSLLVGIAIDQQSLGGINDPIAKWLAADYPGAPALADGLVIEDLLTMRSGLACNDWDEASPGNEDRMWATQDWVAFWLALPATSAPDTVTSYCTGNPTALGHILANATHQSVQAFAQANLLGPLGIVSAQWNTYDNGTQTDTGCFLHMRPRDMAKLGQLALQRGQWNGAQLVSSAWMDVSTSQHTEFDSEPFDGYGYLWWHGTVQWRGQALPVFFANGAGGQYIFVVPQLDLVVVFTGENYTGSAQEPYHLLQAFVVDAVVD